MKYTYDDLITSFTDARERAKELIEDFPADHINTKPEPGKWSALEIMSHLVQTGNEYRRQIQTLFDNSQADMPRGSEPFEPNIFMRWFIRQVSPQNTRALPTVKLFEPLASSKLDKDQVLNDFRELQDHAIKIITKCKEEELDPDRISIRNPIVKLVPMSLTACYGVMSAHQKRHFEQIEKLHDHFSNPV